LVATRGPCVATGTGWATETGIRSAEARCWRHDPRSAGAFPHRCNVERALRERPQELRLRLAQADPGGPIRRTKHDDLAVVVGSDVRSRRGCQHGKGRRVIAVTFPPDPGDRGDRRALQRKPMLRLRIFPAGKLEEGGSRNDAAMAAPEMPALRPEVED